MNKKLWIRKAASFKEADEYNNEYYRLMSPEERLSYIQICREMYFKLKGIDINEARKRLRRFVKVTKQK